MKHVYVFSSQAETEKFGAALALWMRPGFMILLQGDLGSGKSTLARAIIRAMAPHDPDMDVPSPSFSLLNTYDTTRIPMAHADLYRLDQASAVEELGFSDLLTDHGLIVEWPELLAPALSPHVLTIHLSGSGESRTAHMVFSGAWDAAWQRHGIIERFLQSSGWHLAQRQFLEGDASSRRYEALKTKDHDVILMDMPNRPDGPPVRNGLPYSVIAHLAEGLSAVVGVNRQLRAFGYSAPDVLAYDLNDGLAIIENLGSAVFGRMRQAGEDMAIPMQTAVAVLADMSQRDWPRDNIIDASHSRTIDNYDRDAMLIEVDLILSWYYPHIHHHPVDPALQQSFAAVWQALFPILETHKPVWVMRDYHSPNLIWLGRREGLKRIGVIDSQDAVMGHPAYDLVSLLQDARLDIPADEAAALYQHYENLRLVQDHSFDQAHFSASYAVLGAQRATKILGIFARLAKRDGKPDYLKHMPRVSRYLGQNLEHPALKPLKTWFMAHLPQAIIGPIS